MDYANAQRKRAQRAAYGAYVRLQWRLYRLSPGATGYAALRARVRRAEAHWRGLMDEPWRADPAAGPAAAGLASLNPWGY